jgi:hypothetical protein
VVAAHVEDLGVTPAHGSHVDHHVTMWVTAQYNGGFRQIVALTRERTGFCQQMGHRNHA